MRRCRILIILGLSGSICAGVASVSSAEDRPSPREDEAREKFSKLLLPNGSQDLVSKALKKQRRVVVNAFGGPGDPPGRPPGRPPATPVRPGRPGNRP